MENGTELRLHNLQCVLDREISVPMQPGFIIHRYLGFRIKGKFFVVMGIVFILHKPGCKVPLSPSLYGQFSEEKTMNLMCIVINLLWSFCLIDSVAEDKKCRPATPRKIVDLDCG